MTKLSALIAASAVLVAASIAPALADGSVTGTWSYKVGTTGTPCTVTLAAGPGASDGAITSGANCPGGLAEIAHWRMNGSHLELQSSSGDLVGVLHKAGAGYTGSQVDGGRKITLTPA